MDKTIAWLFKVFNEPADQQKEWECWNSYIDKFYKLCSYLLIVAKLFKSSVAVAGKLILEHL